MFEHGNYTIRSERQNATVVYNEMEEKFVLYVCSMASLISEVCLGSEVALGVDLVENFETSLQTPRRHGVWVSDGELFGSR